MDIYAKHYEENQRVRFYDCDYKGRIKLSSILRRSAEIAGSDYTNKGFQHEMLWEKDMVFLLSRVSVKILRYPRQPDELLIRTWECGKKGAMFMRGTEFINNEELVISIQSGWVLASPTTRKIHKPSYYDFNMPQDEEKEIFAEPIGKIGYGELSLLGKRTVRITDLDENGHVYNAVYSDMACDFLPVERYEKDIDNFRINYISEAVLGDEIEIMGYSEEKRNVIVGMNNDKKCFECEFIWKS
jgi:acyl-ACP thioesterase